MAEVTAVAPDAKAHGILRRGDRIKFVNEWAADGHVETTQRLKGLKGRIRLTVVRQDTR